MTLPQAHVEMLTLSPHRHPNYLMLMILEKARLSDLMAKKGMF